MNLEQCPFCNIPEGRVIKENQDFFIVRDIYPVTKLHSLIISKRHIESFFQLSFAEQISALELINWAQKELKRSDKTIQSFNIGINDGVEAGQTIPHCHIHLIPRRELDTSDPRGGVRGVIAEKQKY